MSSMQFICYVSIIQGRQPLSSYIVLVSTLNLPEGAEPSCYELHMIDMSCDSTIMAIVQEECSFCSSVL